MHFTGQTNGVPLACQMWVVFGECFLLFRTMDTIPICNRKPKLIDRMHQPENLEQLPGSCAFGLPNLPHNRQPVTRLAARWRSSLEYKKNAGLVNLTGNGKPFRGGPEMLVDLVPPTGLLGRSYHQASQETGIPGLPLIAAAA
jgi:hypothetical protein